MPRSFQEAPAALNRGVRAVGGRRIGETHPHGIRLHTLHQPLPTVGPAAMVLWTVLPMEHQRGEVGAPLTDRLPPLGEASHEPVPGDFGGHALHQQGLPGREAAAPRGERGRWLKSMSERRDEGAALAPTRAGANVDGGLGSQGEASEVVRGLRGLRERVHLVAAGVGCRDFLCS
jgi:hypothetical protein